MEDKFGAFMPDGRIKIESVAKGSLAGYKFAAKDVFDVAGYPTSNGHPLWSETHAFPEKHAGAVEALLTAGAALVGKTVCDEMCYSLAGDNIHYGAPLNPAAPDRAVGGSSSGSAAAVAGGLANFALGTDCGGSVRCPASFSGIYGIRPTHGRVDASGVAPLANSFDVVGWFARDPKMFASVGDVLLDDGKQDIIPRKGLIATDAFARLLPREQAQLEDSTSRLVEQIGLEVQKIQLSEEGLDRWFNAFRHLQGREIWQNHRDWIQQNKPEFGPGVKERFEFAATLTAAHSAEHQPVRDKATARLARLLDSGDTVIFMPTAPVSPKRDADASEVENFRARTMGLTCPAGLSGSPQISIPITNADEPIGISIMGPRGSDEALLQMAMQITT
ncbi:MAG: amidase [Pseudomonadota bacterium]|nr:amidase [Pseudomonadota bacterium]